MTVPMLLNLLTKILSKSAVDLHKLPQHSIELILPIILLLILSSIHAMRSIILYWCNKINRVLSLLWINRFRPLILYSVHYINYCNRSNTKSSVPNFRTTNVIDCGSLTHTHISFYFDKIKNNNKVMI